MKIATLKRPTPLKILAERKFKPAEHLLLAV
jgi:hypothetical protein